MIGSVRFIDSAIAEAQYSVLNNATMVTLVNSQPL
jgi:hypothetical protein